MHIPSGTVISIQGVQNMIAHLPSDFSICNELTSCFIDRKPKKKNANEG